MLRLRLTPEKSAFTQQAGATPFVAHLEDFSRRRAGASPTSRFVTGGGLPAAAGLRIEF